MENPKHRHTTWDSTILFTMLIAALVVHSGDPFGKQELGLLYAALFSVTALNGGGSFSLDKIIRKKNI